MATYSQPDQDKEQAIRLNNFGQGANNQADDDWVCNGSYLRYT